MFGLTVLMNTTIVTKQKCPSCGKRKIVTDDTSGELFCAYCGFVINEKIRRHWCRVENIF